MSKRGSGNGSQPETDSPRQSSLPTKPADLDLLPAFSPLSNTPFSRSKIYPTSRWFLLALFLAVTMYTGGRILWNQSHTRLSYQFGPRLNLTYAPERYGLDGEYRLKELNGVPVGDPREIPALLDKAKPKEARLRFEKGEGPGALARDVIWLERGEYPVLFFAPDGSFALAPGADRTRFGLEEGDRIVAVNGLKPEELDASGLDDKRLHHSMILRLTVQPAADISQHDLVVCRVEWNTLWVRFALGVVFGLLGIATYWLKPETKSSAGFLVFSFAAALMWLSRSIHLHYRLEWESTAYLLLQIALPAATLLFMLTFTPLRLLFPRTRLAVGVALGLCAVTFISNFLLFPEYASEGLLGMPFFYGWLGLQLVLILCTLSIDWLLRALQIPLGATDPQRGSVVRLATLVGFLPVTGYSFISYTFFGSTPPLFFELTVLAFPAIIGYAIVRHNLLEIGELVREAFVYFFLVAAVSVAYAVSVALLLPAIDRLIPMDMTWVKSVIIAVIALAAVFAHGRFRNFLHLRFRGVPADYESLLESFSEKASVERSPQAFCQMVAKELSRIAYTPHVGLITRYPGDEDWTLSAMTPAPRSGQALDVLEPLLFLLQSERREVFRDDLIDDVRYGEIRVRALAAMQMLHASVIYPMMIQDRMIGAISFGDKVNFRNYPAPELRALRRVARHVGFSLWTMADTMLSRRSLRIVDLYPRWPEKIGRWAIKGFLGQGGMSYVYHGQDGETEAAIKVANGGVQASVTLLERFHREALAMKRIDHPNIVQIHEVAHADGEPYIALEYFPEGSLRDLTRLRGKMDEQSVLHFARQAVRGLDAALKHGIIHRDIKPRNLFVTKEGALKVGDFGLARMDDISTITSLGDVLGTPDYMSPEVARGQTVDWRCDQYALGITMYECLAGKRPFKSDRTEALIFQYLTSAIPDIRKERPDVSAATSKLIARMIAKDPCERIPSYRDLVEEIDRALKKSVATP